jgi:lipoprotein-releasing system permease protein
MNFNLIKFIANRFSQSSKRQRFLNFARMIALISVMLGSMALVISLAVIEGFETKLRENAVKFTSHISIRSFRKSPMQNYPATISFLQKNIPQIKSVAPVIEREGLVRSKSYVEGILIRSFMPKYDITNLKANIIGGRFNFTSDTASEVIIGERLAKKLKTKVGDNIVLYTMKGQITEVLPDTRIDKFKVTGIYRTGMAQYDDIFVYIPVNTATNFFQLAENSATSYEVMLNNIDEAESVSKEIDRLLGFPYYSLTVFDIHKGIFAWIELQKQPIPLVLGLISIVAVLNIVTTLLIIVVEKIHSIGILRALGMNHRGILSIFVVQGLVIGITGTLIGCGIGFSVCWLQKTFEIIKLQGEIYFLDVVPIHFSLWHYELVIGISCLMSFVATLIPSLIAVRISPLKAIRFK